MNEKAGRRWVDFTNMFSPNFYERRSQKGKIDSQVINIFALLGSALVNAANKILMKLTHNLKKIIPSYLHFSPNELDCSHFKSKPYPSVTKHSSIVVTTKKIFILLYNHMIEKGLTTTILKVKANINHRSRI